MTLHDTDALIVETASAAESLPDPTTVGGRSHDLTNTSLSTAVWSSTGATPFTENGVNVATISVGAGQKKRVQSDGTRWVVRTDPSSAAAFTGSAVTDSAGKATFTLPAGRFASAPVCTASILNASATTNGTWAEIFSASAATVVVQVWTGKGVLIGGQTTEHAAAGVTVHLHAVLAP